MAQALESPPVATAADLAAMFGPIPLSRVRFEPAPGQASEQDVIEIHDRENRLFELVDGILLEKAVGTYESYLAGKLVIRMGGHAEEQNLGVVLPPDGMLRLSPGLVRIPDVSFISWDRLPEGEIHRPIANLYPDLAAEIISSGNTPQEMNRKLDDYFAAGVRLVWYIYPDRREAHVYSSRDSVQVLTGQDKLDDADVVPGFRLSLAGFFAEPRP